jgi:hypothetical protein
MREDLFCQTLETCRGAFPRKTLIPLQEQAEHFHPICIYWPPPATEKPQLPDASIRIPYSEFIVGGKYDMKDVIQPTYDEINKKYGLKEKQD